MSSSPEDAPWTRLIDHASFIGLHSHHEFNSIWCPRAANHPIHDTVYPVALGTAPFPALAVAEHLHDPMSSLAFPTHTQRSKMLSLPLRITAGLLCFLLGTNAFAEDFKPELFRSAELIYQESFDKDGPLKNDHWVIRQSTRWNIENGVLSGKVADESFQKKMQAKNDGHDGTRPVVFLTPIPDSFVLQMRVRYDETNAKGRDRGSLLDLGHHATSFIFREDETKLTLQKKHKIMMQGNLFPLNQWNEVTIEFKTGVVSIQVNEQKKVIKHPLVHLRKDREVNQIDFKGQDFGTVRIDWIKLYNGIE